MYNSGKDFAQKDLEITHFDQRKIGWHCLIKQPQEIDVIWLSVWCIRNSAHA